MTRATARAHPNIAFIKYWGNIDHHLRLPANGSLSMNLDGLFTETTVEWLADLEQDMLYLNGTSTDGTALDRVRAHLDALRSHLGIGGKARVTSANNFPMGAGIASSASAFAALTAAAVTAAGVSLDERTLTTLARLGSGSASRSVPGGFVEWHAAETHELSYAESIAPSDHWHLVDVIAVISAEHKATTSQAGHRTADTSDLQAARVAGASERLALCRESVLNRNFATFTEIVEHDSNLMHAVMMTSRPPLFYWMPTTLTVMEAVRQWRQVDGLRVCYTLDAGPNVHCLCISEDAEEVRKRLENLSGITDIRVATVGGPAHIITADA